MKNIHGLWHKKIFLDQTKTNVYEHTMKMTPRDSFELETSGKDHEGVLGWRENWTEII